MLTWLNEVRRTAGVGPLLPHAPLAAAARAKCAEVVALGRLAHRGGRWGDPRRLQAAFGVRARVMGGENLAAYRDAAAACRALLASPGHRSNILHPAHAAVGVAILPWGKGIPGVAVCQEFAGGLFP